ncbi:hypothetical protein [Micromonospora sp. RP3T]|uniref:hypothetical protein n=1 Tax=Micromonospora sp. RP3T TaxID=2135446 RepID=UPI000D16093B|nr:hypothetical protein [Micromonospora sp. RP3T]PTA42518.1 hypothetical protein C8054_30305 [Micromonospora sp. RP3T]
MSNLPTLPECGAPATLRIELYTTDSLDACAYTCAAHTPHAVGALGRAGLDAYPIGLGPGVSRPCGHVFVYPTGALAAPDDLAHPRWCDRDRCRLRGRHCSRARRVDTNRAESSVVEVGLVRALHPAAETMVSLSGAASAVVLSVGQARVLRYRLAHLLDLAAVGRQR